MSRATLGRIREPAVGENGPRTFHRTVIEILRRIPRGKVASYGLIAALAGSHRAARQVARILHSCSDSEKLPWHRVLGKDGTISLRPGHGMEIQRSLLEAEGVRFLENGAVDLERFGWSGPQRPPSPQRHQTSQLPPSPQRTRVTRRVASRSPARKRTK